MLLEEISVVVGLNIALLLLYLFLYWHYTFAFKLLKDPTPYIYIQTKIFLWLKRVFIALFFVSNIFYIYYLADTNSVKELVMSLYKEIPSGFFLTLLFVTVKIAILIVVSKYILKLVSKYVSSQTYRYIKYIFISGIFYRVTLYVPFLELISNLLLLLVIGFTVYLSVNLVIKKYIPRG